MRLSRITILFLTLFLSGIVVTPVGAQTTQAGSQANGQERAASLRSQMAEVELRQAELQTRLGQLELDLKPESIEGSLAGIGSTRPEDLREHRRRQLQLEKNHVLAQINELAVSRTRLEAAIVRADFEAHRQIVDLSNRSTSALAQPTSTAVSRAGVGVRRRSAGKNKRVRRPVQE
jgi:hypothetical protein